MSPSDEAQLARNLEAVEHRIHGACERAGRARAEVAAIAVTKYGGPRLCGSLVALGWPELGENRVDHLNACAAALGPDSGARWHMIGHLQRNKVKRLEAPLARLHSLDSLKLAAELDKRLSAPLEVLIQVNIAGEDQKSGLPPAELPALLDGLARLERVRARGLMTMPPLGTPEAARPVFRRLRELRDELGSEGLSELSMGMSADFEVAIEEGATCLRLGRVLYESLRGLDNDLSSVSRG